MRATERYIREQLNNPSAAAKLTRRVYDAIMLLEDNPFMGTELCSRYAVDTDIRFLVVAKQIVFYRVVGNEYVGRGVSRAQRRNPLYLTGGYKSDKIGELRKTLYKINQKRR